MLNCNLLAINTSNKPNLKLTIMKKAILPTMLLAFISLFTSNVQAGTVSIDSTNASSATPCNPNQRSIFWGYGSTTGYNSLSDTINLEIFFGDGSSSTYNATIDSFGNYSWQIVHQYQSFGQFTVAYIATGPDLAADTVIVPNAVVIADSCGNISGKVYADDDLDCTLDANESTLEGIRVDAYQGSTLINSDWTDSSGNYYLSVPINQTYTIQTNGTTGYNFICPTGGTHTVTSVPSTGNDFAMDCGNGFDLYPHASGWSVPGQTLNLYLSVYNAFCQNQSGTVHLVFEDSLYDYGNIASIPPNAINGDTVSWNFSGVNNTGWLNHFSVNVGAFTDTTAQIGDTVCVKVIVNPINGDNHTANNIRTFCIPVRTSYDPNIKVASPLGVGDSGRVSPNIEMTYTVHFQNTGTAQAYNIYILDTLDVNTLDPSTINVIGASHAMSAHLISPNQNVLKFRFDDILLPDSNTNEPESHGWVTYTIAQQPNLNNGTTIQNSASIYFDYNPAVVTNYTLNTIDDQIVGIKSIKTEQAQSFAHIYPNPAADVLNIDFSANVQATELRILAINGKLIRAIKQIYPSNQLNISDLKAGIYLIDVRAKNGERQVSKLVINK